MKIFEELMNKNFPNLILKIRYSGTSKNTKDGNAKKDSWGYYKKKLYINNFNVYKYKILSKEWANRIQHIK